MQGGGQGLAGMWKGGRGECTQLLLEEPIFWCDAMISPFLKGDHWWQCRGEIGWETREGV